MQNYIARDVCCNSGLLKLDVKTETVAVECANRVFPADLAWSF